MPTVAEILKALARERADRGSIKKATPEIAKAEAVAAVALCVLSDPDLCDYYLRELDNEIGIIQHPLSLYLLSMKLYMGFHSHTLPLKGPII